MATRQNPSVRAHSPKAGGLGRTLPANKQAGFTSVAPFMDGMNAEARRDCCGKHWTGAAGVGCVRTGQGHGF